MARQRKLSPERKAFINSLIEHYHPEDAHDVQEMLKDLLRMMSYSGGNISSDDSMPDIAKHDIIHTYEIYLAATSLRSIAERDIALCNKKISKAIRNRKASRILKTRVDVEQKLYYSYRFISEFTGDTIDSSDADAFKNPHIQESSLVKYCLKEVSTQVKETKQQIDIILKNMNDAAEFITTKSNLSLQWFMMIVTILSLIIAIFSSLHFDITLIWNCFINFIKTIDIL